MTRVVSEFSEQLHVGITFIIIILHVLLGRLQRSLNFVQKFGDGAYNNACSCGKYWHHRKLAVEVCKFSVRPVPGPPVQCSGTNVRPWPCVTVDDC